MWVGPSRNRTDHYMLWFGRPGSTLGADLLDPDGSRGPDLVGRHHRELLVCGPSASLTLELERGAAYELQSEERHPEIPVQPFPDG